MKSILVMLSSYNGEKYIKQQIESILTQKDVKLDLMVRDDGSKDSTLKILNELKEKHKNITVYTEKNVGCKKSFYTLIKYAAENPMQYDYYAFSDQDDVWLEDKSVVAVNKLDVSDNPYRLYSSVPINVDSNLNRLPQHSKYYNADTLGSNIISSHIQGSTAVFSRDLLMLLAKAYDTLSVFPERLLPYHDAYLALVAYAMDSYIVSDKDGYLLYRQHGDNLVGGKGQNIINAQIDRFKSDYRRFTKVRVFLSSVDHTMIPEHNLDLLLKCSDVNKTLTNRLRVIFDKRIRSGSIKRDLFFWFNVLIKRW